MVFKTLALCSESINTELISNTVALNVSCNMMQIEL